MKPHFKWLALAGIAAALAMPAALGSQTTQAVYTWVDSNGVRHYSDTPHNPKATLITVDASAPASGALAASAPAAAKGAGSVGRPEKVPAPATRETPAERQARCDKLRQEVQQLQSARRVKVTENGKSRYVSGDDLVQFRKRMQQRMQQACSPPSS